MARTKDLSPSLPGLIPAEVELAHSPGVMQMGQQIGGISAFSSSFKRGSGDKVFGVDDRGLWLGAADWDDAPFRVDMEGNMYFSAADDDGDSLVIDAENLRLVLYVAGIPQALWGKHVGGF